MKVPISRPFLLGEWTVNAELDTLEKDGVQIKLEPRLMKVLVLLANSGGQLVSREEILQSVWPDVTVGDEALTQAVSALRKHLLDSSRAPRYIQTVPKKGYRLLAPVRSAHPQPAANTSVAAPVWARRFAMVAALAAVFFIGFAVTQLSSSHATMPEDLEIVTALRGRESDPAVSPDGTRVAFVWGDPQGGTRDLYVKALAGESMLRLTRDRGVELSPAWSPEGHRIAFARVDHGQCGVFLHEITRGKETRISDCKTGAYPELAWSPRGDLLAISDSHGTNGRYAISLMSADGTRRRRITGLIEGYGDHSPAFSPDGEHLAFVRTEGMGTSDVWIHEIGTAKLSRVTSRGERLQGLAWLDRERIAFASRRGGDFSLWSVSRRGGEPEWIGLSGARSVRPARASANALVFEQQKFDSDIWMLNAHAPDDHHRLIASTTWEDEPRFSPDGSSIAFVSRRSGNPEIWIAASDGSGARQLTELRADSLRTPRWSADGKRVVFAATSSGASKIYMAEVERQTVEAMTTGQSNDLAPAFSPDGRRVYFTSDRQGCWGIWALDAETGSLAPILDVPAGSMFVGGSPEQLYFSRMDQPGVWRTDLAGDGQELVVRDLEPGDWANWELAGESIYYLRRDSGAGHLFQRRLDTGTTTLTASLPMSEDDYGLSISPDGLTILFSKGDRSESDLMLLTLRNGRSPEKTGLGTLSPAAAALR